MGKSKAKEQTAAASSDKKAKQHPQHSALVAPQKPVGVQKAKAPKASKPQVVEHQGQKVNKKQKSSEIDDIFSVAKKKKSAAKVTVEDNAKDKEHAPKQVAKVAGSKDDIFGAEVGKKRKKTEEGWNVYTEAELNLGRAGGDTELCPFDCDCCY